MCSHGTSCPSVEQTRFCWILPPSLSWSMWKRTSLGEVAEKSFTGTLTRPKLMEPLQMGRGITNLLVACVPVCRRRRERVSGPSLVFQHARRRAAVLSLHDLHVGALGGGLILHGAGRRRARTIFRRRRNLAGGMSACRLSFADGVVLEDGVDLAAQDEDEPGDVEPDEEHHHAADRSVRRVVAAEMLR